MADTLGEPAGARGIQTLLGGAGTVAEIGLELPRSSPGNTTIPDPGGAESGALPANLKHVVANWGSLTDDDRRRIRAIVDGQLA